jgi:N-carbamoylputrescine amidase
MTIVALEQFDPVPGLMQANTAEILTRANKALGNGANIAVFPELANSGYVTDPDLVKQAAQPLDGPLVAALSSIARQHGGLVATGFCEQDGSDFYNSVVLVGADGPILHYRKLHLFDREKFAFTAGNTLPVAETEFGVIGICVCYDLRFVEVLRILSLKGADIVLAPAAWVGGFDPSVPAVGLTRQAEGAIVQANLDQVAVVAVSQVTDRLRGSVRMLGGSIAVDAFGQVVAGPLSRSLPESVMAEIDIAAGRTARIRSELIQPRSDRRSDVYSLISGEETL